MSRAQKKFNRFVSENNIVSIVPTDTDNTVFVSCDILGEHSDCYECLAVDADGNEFTLDVTAPALACWTNDDWTAYE